MPESMISPEDQMMQWITTKWITKPIYVISELGIADLLCDGPKSVEALAKETDTHLLTAIVHPHFDRKYVRFFLSQLTKPQCGINLLSIPCIALRVGNGKKKQHLSQNINIVCHNCRGNMVSKYIIPMDSKVEKVFNSYPKEIKSKLLFLRRLIFETTESIKEIGELEETLKWGEPSYLTPVSKSGSTVRIAWKDAKKEQYSIFFKCTANLVPAFKEKFPGVFNFGGNRSIDFKIGDDVPEKELKQCIALALTYHRNKKLDPTDRWKMVDKFI